MKRLLFVIAGTVALGIGVIGIVLPVLPTTPFLLIAAFCYMRGSRRLYDALLRRRIVGAYVRNYLEGRGMSLKTKIWTLAMLWTVMVGSAIVIADSLVVRVILAIILAGVTMHIISLKTASNSAKPSKDPVP